MKEAESDFEIEDVLSSIRRLVSQDSRPARVQRVSFRQPAPVPLEDECLVLTPAQRIAAAPKDVEDPPAEPDIVEELSRLETSIAEMEASVAEAELDLTNEDDFAESVPDAEPETDLAVQEEPEPEAALHLESSLEDVQDDDIVEVEAPAAEEPVVDQVPDEDPVVVEAVDDLPEAPADLPERPAPQIVRTDRSRPVMHLVQDEPEPILSDADGIGGVDEEGLRLLVAQLIREELRGVLGERITHNVRKLVRREIQRALAGHDLE